MSVPDYEGNYYSDSDQDEPDHSPEQSPPDKGTFLLSIKQSANPNSDADIRMANSTDGRGLQKDLSNTPENNLPTKVDLSGDHKSAVQDGAGHLRSASASRESDPGALDDLLDDYQDPSQPNTPGFSPAELAARHFPDKDTPAVKNDPEMVVTNIRRIDANPAPTTQSAIIAHSTSAPIVSAAPKAADPKDGVSAFVEDVMKAWDSPTTPATQGTPNPTSPSQSTFQLPLLSQDTPRSVSSSQVAPKSPTPSQDAPASPSTTDPYTSSNYWAQMRANLKGKRSASNDMSRTSSHKSRDSISESASIRSVQKPSSPGPARSSNESSRSATRPLPASDGRSGSFTSYTPIPKFPDTRRPSSPGIPSGRPPTIDTTGKSPFSNAPEVTQQRRGSASDMKRPIIDTNGSGQRSGSNSPVTGSSPFSNSPNYPDRPSSRNRNRDDVVGKLPVFAPREGLPDIRVAERIGRPQSPSSGMSSGTVSQQPTSSQSPGPGISPARGVVLTQPVDKASRTPSPLKDIPEEQTEIGLSTTNRTPSPLRNAPLANPVHFPSHIEVPAKSVNHSLVSPSPPPPVIQVQTSQPLSPRPERKVALPIVPPISIPPPAHPDIDPIRSRSSDAEWKGDNEEEPVALPADKRITVFLQEAGKRKESQGLPPLPTEPPPPIPQSSQLPVKVVQEEHIGGPIEMSKKQIDNPSTPLIPPPTAPVPESQLPVSESGSDLEEQSDHPEKNSIQPTATSNLTSAPFSIYSDQQSRLMADPPAVVSSPSGEENNVGSSSGLQLPEFVSRPMTWGPLTFESFNNEAKAKVNIPEPIDEESDWEVVERDETQEEAIPAEDIEQTSHAVPEPTRDQDIVEDITEQSLHAVQGPAQNPFPATTSQSTHNALTLLADIGHVESETPLEQNESIGNGSQIPIDSPDAHDETAEAHVPPESDSEEDIPTRRVDKGKGREIFPEDPITNTEAMSDDDHTDPESTSFRSKYMDRDITSFIVPDHVIMSRNKSVPPKPALSVLQTQPVPEPLSPPPVALDFLPQFMLSKDIPEMSTFAQRIGAYQSRRDQMIRADTGLRGWLLQVQQTRPTLSLPQRSTLP